MYAVIETGGKQIRCEVGEAIYVEKLNVEAGETVTFDKVLVANTGKSTKVGTPYVKDAKVTAVVDKQGKGEKIIVFKYKSKKGSTRRKHGHRQPYTKLTIQNIEA